MSSRGHFEVIESDEYGAQYDTHVAGNARLEQAYAGLIQWLERAPQSFPVSRHVHGDYWTARLYGPPALTVFYSIDDKRRTVTLNGMVPWS